MFWGLGSLTLYNTQIIQSIHYIWINGWTDVDAWMDGRMDECMKEWTNGWTNGWRESLTKFNGLTEDEQNEGWTGG